MGFTFFQDVQWRVRAYGSVALVLFHTRRSCGRNPGIRHDTQSAANLTHWLVEGLIRILFVSRGHDSVPVAGNVAPLLAVASMVAVCQ